MTTRVREIIEAIVEANEDVFILSDDLVCDSFLGEGYLVAQGGKLEVGRFIGVYSDCPENRNPFRGILPDAIWCMKEDAVMLYKIPEL